jgi:GDP-L-fucose synthase
MTATILSFQKSQPVLVTGAGGMLGRAVIRELRSQGYTNLLTPSRADLDLADAGAVECYFARHKPAAVFHLAAVVYGLLGNMKNQISALLGNTAMNTHVLNGCVTARTAKIVFAGSVASYPYPYPALPLTEDMLWAGKPHGGEYGYATAKRHAMTHLDLIKQDHGIDSCTALLTNLYGPHDRFDDYSGHVVPSLIKKLYDSCANDTPLKVWGDGRATRDFLYVDDAARAIVLCLHEMTGAVNISSGREIRIADVVTALVAAARFRGPVIYETDKPVGIPVRSVCNRLLKSRGFQPEWDLDRGIQSTWDWFVKNHAAARLGGAGRIAA